MSEWKSIMSEEEIAAKKQEMLEWAEDDRIKKEAEEAEEAAERAAAAKEGGGDDGDVDMEKDATEKEDEKEEPKEEALKVQRAPTPENVQTYFLVKWCSLGYDEATWERREDIERLEDVVRHSIINVVYRGCQI